MSSSPWSPVAGAPPRAAPAAVSSAARERHPVEEEGSAAAAQEATRARLPSEDRCSEVNTQEHGEKINKYQVVLAARLKAKYFSSETFEKGDVFEEIAIQSETIHLSRWPFTRLFSDPVKLCQEISYAEKGICPSLAGEDMPKK
ncbi:uncharacterized protein LOC133895785 isoform X2 [Phragmites australis]|uniref:uncharacterized protein LOC133895785 isoform X2 n=1 Tax=Phragmites australis TaxID=29695 RepID=UPI002D772AD6|nr:uncharacterized protein LOC133895785 isoform X2 [Phragmites australis]